MIPNLDPFTTLMDRATGLLEPERAVTERRLSDMPGYYLEDPPAGDNRLVYRVFHIPVPETNAEIQCSTTVLEPGTVGREFFMTKGHFHEVRDRSEVYLGLRGQGRLVLATEDGRRTVEPLRPGTVSYVPGGWAHRSVNVGTEPLVFFAAYVGDAGHDYGTIAAQGFPVLVLAGDGGPEVVENPRYDGGR
jgi:glucose-6-phosphate isomerase, archaeal